MDSNVSGYGGCEVLRGKSCKSSINGCGEVAPRLSNMFGGEVVVVLGREDSLDDPRLIMVQGRTLMRAVLWVTLGVDEALKALQALGMVV
ncbi:hypothetical protein Tco_0612737 [Tanacetum coccineum]